MTAEERAKIHEVLNDLSKDRDLSVEQMERISEVREYVDRDDESAGAIKMWEDKYKELEDSYQRAMEDNARITEAYRKRWDETTTGTLVNGTYVSKEVDRVSERTYDRLMKGE